MTRRSEVVVHRHTGAAMPVNAYLVETPAGVVVVDGLLTISDARALRRRVHELAKPLLAVLVTHAHPDHYGGIVELVGSDAVPVLATVGVDEVIRRDDEIKESIIRPMFGEEWPHRRMFPSETVADGDVVTLDGIPFTVIDLGPGESPHDSVWLVGDERLVAFAGDEAYQQMHCYLADGFWESWLQNIARLRSELPAGSTVHFGHGEPHGVAPFDWQEGYIRTFIDAIKGADWSDTQAAKRSVTTEMTRYLAGEDLRFLMELSIEPVAASLGLLEPAG